MRSHKLNAPLVIGQLNVRDLVRKRQGKLTQVHKDKAKYIRKEKHSGNTQEEEDR